MGRSAHTWRARWGRTAPAVKAPAGLTVGLLFRSRRGDPYLGIYPQTVTPFSSSSRPYERQSRCPPCD